MQAIHKITAHTRLSGTALKMIALAFMVLDHIHYMFGFTGLVPDFFSMLGRISAPLFLFCLAEGFAHTHDRRRYFLRIYLIAAGMASFLFLMAYTGLFVRPDGFFPQNGMMTTCAILLVIWQGIDWLRERRFVRGALAVAIPIALPFMATQLFIRFPAASMPLGFLFAAVLPLWGWLTPDAGLPIMLVGIVLYLFRGRRALQVTAFAAVTMLYNFVYIGSVVSALPGFAPIHMFTMYYEWYEVFAVIPMLCYNGQRGRGYKRLFYAFYPAHIYALYALSYLAMSV